MNILGRVTHAGRRMKIKTTPDEKEATALNTLANCIGGSKSSFIPDLAFQLKHELSDDLTLKSSVKKSSVKKSSVKKSPVKKALKNGSWTVHSPIPKPSDS
jgi:hypothetical protein